MAQLTGNEVKANFLDSERLGAQVRATGSLVSILLRTYMAHNSYFLPSPRTQASLCTLDTLHKGPD